MSCLLLLVVMVMMMVLDRSDIGFGPFHTGSTRQSRLSIPMTHQEGI
jgi:hypothetical protein